MERKVDCKTVKEIHTGNRAEVIRHDIETWKSVESGRIDYEAKPTNPRMDELPSVRMCKRSVRAFGLYSLRTTVEMGKKTTSEERTMVDFYEVLAPQVKSELGILYGNKRTDTGRPYADSPTHKSKGNSQPIP